MTAAKRALLLLVAGWILRVDEGLVAGEQSEHWSHAEIQQLRQPFAAVAIEAPAA